MPNRGSRINSYSCRGIFLGRVQTQNQRPLTWFCAKFILWPLRQSPAQGVEINIENKNGIEPGNEVVKIARATAKKGHRNSLVIHQGVDFADIPDVMFMTGAIKPLTRLWITLIGQDPITMNGMMATPQQLIAYCGLA